MQGKKPLKNVTKSISFKLPLLLLLLLAPNSCTLETNNISDTTLNYHTRTKIGLCNMQAFLAIFVEFSFRSKVTGFSGIDEVTRWNSQQQSLINITSDHQYHIMDIEGRFNNVSNKVIQKTLTRIGLKEYHIQ